MRQDASSSSRHLVWRIRSVVDTKYRIASFAALKSLLHFGRGNAPALLGPVAAYTAAAVGAEALKEFIAQIYRSLGTERRVKPGEVFNRQVIGCKLLFWCTVTGERKYERRGNREGPDGQNSVLVGNCH